MVKNFNSIEVVEYKVEKISQKVEQKMKKQNNREKR